MNTVPASSGAVAAHLGAISGDARQVEFDMTLVDADTESLSTHSAGQIEHQGPESFTTKCIATGLEIVGNRIAGTCDSMVGT